MTKTSSRAYVMRDYQQFMATMDLIRHHRELSYRALAEKVGTGNTHVGSWMRGEVVASGTALWNLADALGYDIALIPRGGK